MADHHDKHDDKHAKAAHAKPHGGGAPHGGDHEEAHEGAPEWLISFADNTALMMGFFVILLAMNMAPKGSSAAGTDGTGTAGEPTTEQLDFALSVRDGFNNPVSIDSTDPRDAMLVQRLREKRGKAREQGASGQHDQVQSPEVGKNYNVSGVITFDVKSEKLTEADIRDVVAMAEKVRGLSNVVQLSGYSDPFETELPRQTFDLTYRRAMAVAVILAQEGIAWDRIRLVAGGVYEGVREQYDESTNDRARCVEMSLLEILAKPNEAQPDEAVKRFGQKGASQTSTRDHDGVGNGPNRGEAVKEEVEKFQEGFTGH